MLLVSPRVLTGAIVLAVSDLTTSSLSLNYDDFESRRKNLGRSRTVSTVCDDDDHGDQRCLAEEGC